MRVKKEQLTPKLFDLIAQRAHWLFGAFMVESAYLIFGRTFCVYTAIGVFVWSIWKEFYWDPKYESAEVAGSGVRDFFFYCFGLFIGSCVVWFNLFKHLI